MAGASTTVSVLQAQIDTPPMYRCFKIDWVADDTDGSVLPATLPLFDGEIVLVVTVPGAVTPPTANYDVTFPDATGLDVMHGAMLNRSPSAAENDRCPVNGGSETMDRPVVGQVTVTIEGNLVNSATGIVYVYIREHY